MFERFTARARQVVVLAQDEARALRHNYIGTEHLLLGLLREQEGVAARVLDHLGIDVDDVRARVAEIVGGGDQVTGGPIPFTPRSKKVLELSLREARSLRHNYLGTEHILLGLVREQDGIGARILLERGAGPDAIRNEVIRMLSGPGRTAVAGGVEEHASRQGPFTTGATAFTHAARVARPLHETTGRLLTVVLAVLAFPAGILVGWLIWG